MERNCSNVHVYDNCEECFFFISAVRQIYLKVQNCDKTYTYQDIIKIYTKGNADVIAYTRLQVLKRENGVTNSQGCDGGHHRLVLNLPQFWQYNVNRQSGDQEYDRDDADDANQSVLPYLRLTQV